MILYLAGVNGDQFGNLANGLDILTTYWETRKWKDGKLGEFKRNHQFKRLFLDCGAYSAWSNGITIDIQKYCDYLKSNLDGMTEYPQLDVKGDFEATKANLAYMEAQGLHPMPVFHMTNMPIEYFKELVDKGYKRIAIGAVAGEKGNRSIMNDLKFQTIFSHIIDKETKVVKVKLHAFGVTGLATLLKYPFWSADSTSWLGGAKFGSINWFNQQTGKLEDGGTADAFLRAFHRLDAEHQAPSRSLARSGKNYLRRLALCRDAYVAAGAYATKVWESRGFSFLED